MCVEHCNVCLCRKNIRVNNKINRLSFLTHIYRKVFLVFVVKQKKNDKYVLFLHAASVGVLPVTKQGIFVI